MERRCMREPLALWRERQFGAPASLLFPIGWLELYREPSVSTPGANFQRLSERLLHAGGQVSARAALQPRPSLSSTTLSPITTIPKSASPPSKSSTAQDAQSMWSVLDAADAR